MEPKTYECNDELAAILMQNGFVDMTDAIDKRKGKREFRKGIRSRFVLRFDYINLDVFENSTGCNFGNSRIIADDLKMLLWYINSSTSDKEHLSDGHFDIDLIRRNRATMTSLLGYSKEFNRSNRDSKRFERLLTNFNAVQLN